MGLDLGAYLMFAVLQQARAAELDSLEAREGEAQLPKGAFLIPSQVCGTKCNNKMTPKQQDYQDQSNDKARPY